MNEKTVTGTTVKHPNGRISPSSARPAASDEPIEVAPRLASSRANTSPSPEGAPVASAQLPSKSIIPPAVQFRPATA